MILDTILGAVLGLVPCCMVGFIPAMMFLVALVVVVYALKAKGRFDGAVKAFASETGLEFFRYSKVDDPQARGEYRSRKVLLDVYAIRVEGYTGTDERDQSFNTYYTRAQAWHKGALKDDIHVSRRGIKTRLDKMLAGRKEMNLGVNAEFDRMYMVSGKDEETARLILAPQAQNTMVSLNRHLREVVIDKENVSCAMIGRITDKGKLRSLLDLACDLAEEAQKR